MKTSGHSDAADTAASPSSGSPSGRALLQTKGITRHARVFDNVGRYLIAAGGIGIIAKETYRCSPIPKSI